MYTGAQHDMKLDQHIIAAPPSDNYDLVGANFSKQGRHGDPCPGILSDGFLSRKPQFLSHVFACMS